MISTRSVGLLIDTVVCLTLAKWETVSGRFGGYFTVRNGIPLLSKCASSCVVAGACVAARHGLPLFTLKKGKEDDQGPGHPRPSLRSASGSRLTGPCRLSSAPA